MTSSTLWADEHRTRYFLVPDGAVFPHGTFVIRAVNQSDPSSGHVPEKAVELTGLQAFEITEDQARRWAKDQLGQTLDELKQSIDRKLARWREQLEKTKRAPVSPDTTVTPSAASALFDLIKSLPRVVGQSVSGDEQRLEAAREKLAELQRKLADSGIDLDERFTGFADRLAALRKETEEKRQPKP